MPVSVCACVCLCLNVWVKFHRPFLFALQCPYLAGVPSHKMFDFHDDMARRFESDAAPEEIEQEALVNFDEDQVSCMHVPP